MVLLGLIPDLSPAMTLPTALLPPLHGPPFASSLGRIPGPRLHWCLPSNSEKDMLASAGAAAWNVLTVLPVAVFPSQRPGFPAAAWIPARLPTSVH